jgi:hypothetical protein
MVSKGAADINEDIFLTNDKSTGRRAVALSIYIIITSAPYVFYICADERNAPALSIK